jgi:hypothetical protein
MRLARWLSPALILVACVPETPLEPGPPPPPLTDPQPVELFILAADSLAASAVRYAEFRRERGLSVEVALMSELTEGAASVIDLSGRVRERIAAAAARRVAERTFFTLLIGDFVPSRGVSPENIPPAYVSTAFDGVVASDNAYADLDDDDIPDLAIGRVPASTDAEVDALREKVAAYEDGIAPGLWNRKVTVFASTGGFGEVEDALIESFANTVLEKLPPAYDITMTYAKETSPYVYIPERFSEKVYERINEGALIAAYVGHGSTDEFADLEWRGRFFPIMDTDDLSGFAVQDRAPILVLIACLTGGFDRGDSLSERILRQPGGPPAVLSSTEISHPVQNGIFTYELSQALTTEKPATLGELVVRAKQRLFTNNDGVRQQVAQLATFVMQPGELVGRNHSHAHMYTTFGDPAMRIPYPREVALDVARAGQTVRVSAALGALPAGEAYVTIETARATIKGAIAEVPPDNDVTRDSVIAANYAAANDKIVVERRVTHQRGALAVELTLPDDLPSGRYLVKLHASGAQDDVIGGTEIVLP